MEAEAAMQFGAWGLAVGARVARGNSELACPGGSQSKCQRYREYNYREQSYQASFRRQEGQRTCGTEQWDCQWVADRASHRHGTHHATQSGAGSSSASRLLRLSGRHKRGAGLEDRVERKVMDFAEAGEDVEPADIVIMNRVLCCYPDMPKLTATASAHCRQVMVLSFPKDRRWTRTGLAVGNLLLRMTHRHFQVFVHRPEQILAVAKQYGLMTERNRPGRFWEVAELRRGD